MKSRYLGILAQGMALVSFFMIVGIAAWIGHSRMRASSDADRLAAIPEAPKAELADITRLYPRLSELARPRKGAGGDVNFLMLGFSNTSLASQGSLVAASLEDFSHHAVTMAFVSDKGRYAVIDGVLYREGEVLEGSGGALRTVTPDKVLIAGREVRQWLEVSNPKSTDAAATDAAAKPEQATEAQALPKSTGDMTTAKAETSEADEAKGSAAQAVQALKGFSTVLDQLKSAQGKLPGSGPSQ
jgi:hypothetical protein